MDKFVTSIKKCTRSCAIFFHNCNKRDGFKALIAAIISILIGIFCGFIVMLCTAPQYAGAGLWALLTSAFTDSSLLTLDIALYSAIPMMLSGLAIAFAFKLKLFNIGITGQVTIGAFTSIIAGLGGANWFVCMLVGALSGAAAGFVPGFLKAKFNVSEVLSGIMLNWILYYMIGIPMKKQYGEL